MTFSPRRRAALSNLADVAKEIERDFSPEILQDRIPAEWHAISDAPDAGRSMMSMRMDKDVLKFFRALGPGYQARINRVLRSFVLGRIAGLVHGPESRPLTDETCPTCGRINMAPDMDAIQHEIADRLNRLRAAKAAEVEGEGDPGGSGLDGR